MFTIKSMRQPALLFSLLLVAGACGSAADTAIDASSAEAPTASDAPAATDASATEDAPESNDEAAAPATSTGAVRFSESVLGQSAAKQQEIQSGRFEMSTTADSTSGVGSITMSGQFNTADKSSEITIDLSGAANAIAAGGGESIPEGMAGLLDEPMVVRTIGDTAYITGGFFSMFSGGADNWLQFDSDDATSLTADFGADIGAASPLDSYENDNVIVDEVGTETVDGANTTHYLVTIVDDDAEPFDVWIDDEGLLRQIVTSQSGSDDETGENVQVELTIRFFDYGEPVTIEAPPQDKVIDGSSMTALLGDN